MHEGTPFQYEGAVQPGFLVDREEELALLARRAADRVAVRLLSPRRYGKTSMLRAHEAALREASWHTAYVDCSRVADLTDVARRLAIAYGPLDMGWLRGRLRQLLSMIGLALPVGPATLTIADHRRRDPQAAEEVIYRLLDLPLTLHERTGAPTLVVFDEFQDLLTARDDLDGLLRSRIQHHGDAAAYVYAGSEPSLMRALFDRRERPLYGQADPLELGTLALDDLAEALAGRFEGEGLDPGESLAVIVSFGAGHPQRTMLLAYHLAERLALGSEPGTPELGEAVIDVCIEKTAGAHAAVWEGLGRMEQLALTALAEGIAPTSRPFAAEHRVSHHGLGKAARRLGDDGELVREGRRWRITDPLLAEWIRRR